METLQRQFNGLDGVVDVIRESLIGASGIPHDKLFGESPSGLGATGESEEKNWAHEVNSFQKRQWYKNLLKFYRLVFLAADSPTKSSLPKSWDIEFESLLQMTEEQLVNIRSTMANIDSTYSNLGILANGEIRASRFGGTKYSIETTLNEEIYQKEQSSGQPEELPLVEEPPSFGGS